MITLNPLTAPTRPSHYQRKKANQTTISIGTGTITTKATDTGT